MQIRREQSGAAIGIGTAYHGALEAMNKGMPVEQAASLARSPAIADEVDREIAACMAAGWGWRWSESPLIRKMIAAEQVFEFKPNAKARWSLAGKIDGIAELSDGRLAVVEYKTTREDLSPGSDYWRRLLIDRQISVYTLGAASLGYNVDTIVYDAARVPGIRPRLLSRKSDERESIEQFSARLMESIAEKPDWYYARNEIPRLPQDIDETRADLAGFAESIRSAQKSGRWPRNTDACLRWGKCPYFGPCADNHNPETQGLPNGFVRVENIHVELTIQGETQDDYANTAEANG